MKTKNKRIKSRIKIGRRKRTMERKERGKALLVKVPKGKES